MAGGTGLPQVLVGIGEDQALSDESGRFVLPALTPGKYPVTWQPPAGWIAGADWPAEVVLRAGAVTELALQAPRLTSVVGTVTIHRNSITGPASHPTGIVTATDASGRISETVVAVGDFRLLLAPGSYRFTFEGEVAPAVQLQLAADVKVDDSGAPITVSLSAIEHVLPFRQTLFPSPNPP